MKALCAVLVLGGFLLAADPWCATAEARAFGISVFWDVPLFQPGAKIVEEDMADVVKRKLQKANGQWSVTFRSGVTEADRKLYLERLTAYARSLQLPDASGTVNSLLRSVTQFVMCSDLEDWRCLEAVPIVQPNVDFRVEDSFQDLGRPRPAGKSLDIEWWFTKRFYKGQATNFLKTTSTIEKLAAEKIEELGAEFVWAAAYGINDTGAFDVDSEAEKADKAALVQRNYNTLISSVQEVSPADKASQEAAAVALRAELERYSMAEFGAVLRDLGLKKRAHFVFDFDAQDRKKNKGMFFQYRDSPKFMIGLSQSLPGQWPGRLEWADAGIMHNKFLVMKRAGKFSLWAGTGNFSDTCMGLEVNTNMFVLIQNRAISRAYLDEFNEMFEFVERDDGALAKIKALIPETIRVGGRFHNEKRPNTNRYFVFDDGTEVRVNFSPTDDATHRVIIPFLRSSRAGDQIRISMMGNGDLEIVRAIQFALAQGANIAIILDNKAGAQTTSWRLHPIANLLQPNPYIASGDVGGKLTIRNGDWLGGMHHQKIATRVREGKATEIIIGSQNWSASGNDSNDENLMHIRNREIGLEIAQAFNHHFDEDLLPFTRSEWTNSSNGPGGNSGNDNDEENGN